MWYCFFFFFFQAEDGIRDKLVTGVQTCALPISRVAAGTAAQLIPGARRAGRAGLRARDSGHLPGRTRRAGRAEKIVPARRDARWGPDQTAARRRTRAA